LRWEVLRVVWVMTLVLELLSDFIWDVVVLKWHQTPKTTRVRDNWPVLLLLFLSDRHLHLGPSLSQLLLRLNWVLCKSLQSFVKTFNSVCLLNDLVVFSFPA
jgi:hypothetical protein